jgi:hypothetical protein
MERGTVDAAVMLDPAATPGDGSYDPETIMLLRSVLDAAWNSLAPAQQACTSKSHLAESLLRLAARGERDPSRLRVGAIVEVSPHHPQA